jgi:peptidoglycan/LPS O-acetylase OafA/YrhL
VHIFFVISAFLITRLLAEEIDRTGGISLGLFYARRSVRIMPPCYVFLAIVAVLTRLGFFAIPPGNFAFAATYTMNYVPQGLWPSVL